jgi:hypothetical protein
MYTNAAFVIDSWTRGSCQESPIYRKATRCVLRDLQEYSDICVLFWLLTVHLQGQDFQYKSSVHAVAVIISYYLSYGNEDYVKVKNNYKSSGEYTKTETIKKKQIFYVYMWVILKIRKGCVYKNKSKTNLILKISDQFFQNIP